MELYRRYAPALLRKGARLLGNPSDAEDVVQAVFVDLIKRGETEVDLPYLFRAVTSRCLNLLRDGKNRERLRSAQQPPPAPPRTLCEDRVISLDILSRLMDRLDERSAEILVYRYFDDLTQEEIADLMKVSRKTVYKRLDRIRDEVFALAGGGAP